MSNLSDCSTQHVDDLMKYLELAFYIPIFILGLLLNIMALLAFCLILRKWTESTIYMTSLALMDLILLLPLPFKMHAANHMWHGDYQTFCSMLENLYFVGIYGSIYMIMCIAVDRWLAICHPFRAKQLRSPRIALLTCVSVWVLGFAAIFPVTSSFGEGRQQQFHCFHRFSNTGWSLKVIVSVLMFGFVVPAVVVVCCSTHTICTLQQSGQNSSQSRACVKIICSSLAAFLVPFTPSHIGIFLQFLVHQEVFKDCSIRAQISLFIQVAMCLSNVTCCLDALCYYFIAHEVRSTRNSVRLSLAKSRRATFSTSEV